MILEELVDWLSEQDPNLVVKRGFSSFHSDRGYYENLAFHPEAEAKIEDMLKSAQSAVGAICMGWKGGEYQMDEFTEVFIGEYGTCGEAITSYTFDFWLLSGVIKRPGERHSWHDYGV